MMIGIFLYLKEAFDTVNHKILINKLYSYGIWFKSYLKSKSQYVTYNENKSDIRDVICPTRIYLGTTIIFNLY